MAAREISSSLAGLLSQARTGHPVVRALTYCAALSVTRSRSHSLTNVAANAHTYICVNTGSVFFVRWLRQASIQTFIEQPASHVTCVHTRSQLPSNPSSDPYVRPHT